MKERLQGLETAIRTENPRKGLLDAFRKRETRLSSLDEKYWTIIGHGSIGAKAEELRAKTWAIEAAGFVPNPRIVLAMGFFEEFRERCGINDAIARGVCSEELILQVRESPFEETEMKAIRRLVKYFRKSFPSVPIAVRSSAYGDCRGTGIYHSEFAPNFRNEDKAIARLVRSIKNVLESEFTRNATAFRKDIGLKSGIAVILEPVVGQFVLEKVPDKYAKKLFGPLFGGLACTSTSEGKGFVQFVAGLPNLAVNGGGVRINENEELTVDDGLFDVLDRFKKHDARYAFSKNLDHLLDWKHGAWIDPVRGCLRIFENVREPLDHGEMRFDGFFRKLRKLETLIGRPQYVEWAMAESNGAMQQFILQIADINPKTDFYDFPESGKALIRSNFVVGTGKRICDGIVFVWNPQDIELLSEYNNCHKNYIVIYSGRLASSSIAGQLLHYCNLSNSSVVVELKAVMHLHHPVSHFGGAIESSGKMFFVTSEMDWVDLEKFEKIRKDNGATLLVSENKALVTASERQQKAIVEIIE